MTRIDLEQIASEFGLLVKKSDVGTYKQWKNAQLDLYLPENREAGYLVRGVYPPVENYVHYPCIDNLDLPTGVTRIKGKPEFSGWQHIYNDDFNEGQLRKELGKLIEEYRRNHDGQIPQNDRSWLREPVHRRDTWDTGVHGARQGPRVRVQGQAGQR